MSMARLSAGAGYRYLLRHTAAGDAARPGSTPLVDYYAATGYPAGRWLGSGLAGLAEGKGLPAGDGGHRGRARRPVRRAGPGHRTSRSAGRCRTIPRWTGGGRGTRWPGST